MTRGLLPWAIVAVGAVCCAAAFGSVFAFVEAVDHCQTLFCDFSRHYRPAARALAEGSTLPSGFVYPPAFGVLLRPLVGVSDQTAVAIWAGVQLLSLLALIGAPLRALRHCQANAPVVYATAIALSFPVLHNLKWGQVSVALVALILLASVSYARLSRSGSAVAGLLLGVATAVKAFPAFFVLLLPRGRRPAAWAAFVSTVLVVALAPIFVIGPAAHGDAVTRIRGDLERMAIWGADDPNSQFVGHVVGRWFPGADPLHISAVSAICLSLLVGLLAWQSLRPASGSVREWPWFVPPALGFTLLPALLPTAWPHYFVYLPLLQAVPISLLPRVVSGRRAATVWTLVVASIALASTPVWALFSDHRAYAASGALLLSHGFACASLHVVLRAMAAPVVSSGYDQRATRSARRDRS